MKDMSETQWVDPQQAYLRDPAFHMLVDSIHAMLRRADYTPSEVRQAAILACTHLRQPAYILMCLVTVSLLR